MMKNGIVKKMVIGILVVLMATGLAACGGSSKTEGSRESVQSPAVENSAETASDKSSAEQETSGNVQEQSETEKVLVVYFSATGTTKDIAEKIAAAEGADLYEIKAAQEYTTEDLNWHDSKSRSTVEQNDSSIRPEIGSEAVSLDGYTKIYIGYPIWWGEEPRIMDTFVESYDFNGITMIPFCTSGGSGIGRSGMNLADNAGSGNWLEGRRFGAGTPESEISSWIEGLQ